MEMYLALVNYYTYSRTLEVLPLELKECRLLSILSRKRQQLKPEL